jgi:hypothetical protein
MCRLPSVRAPMPSVRAPPKSGLTLFAGSACSCAGAANRGRPGRISGQAPFSSRSRSCRRWTGLVGLPSASSTLCEKWAGVAPCPRGLGSTGPAAWAGAAIEDGCRSAPIAARHPTSTKFPTAAPTKRCRCNHPNPRRRRISLPFCPGRFGAMTRPQWRSLVGAIVPPPAAPDQDGENRHVETCHPSPVGPGSRPELDADWDRRLILRGPRVNGGREGSGEKRRRRRPRSPCRAARRRAGNRYGGSQSRRPLSCRYPTSLASQEHLFGSPGVRV